MVQAPFSFPGQAGCWASPLAQALEPSPWARLPHFQGATACMPHFSVHSSVLEPGIQPHRMHRHEQEALTVILEGALDVVLGSPGRPLEVRNLGPGSLFFYGSQLPHVVRGAGPGLARYLVLQWQGVPRRPQGALPFLVRRGFPEGGSGPGELGTLVERLQPRHLERLEVVLHKLSAGSARAFAAGAGELSLVLREGARELPGLALEAPALVFLAKGGRTQASNPGPGQARLYAIEMA